MARSTDDGTAVDDRRLVAEVLAGDPAAERRLYDANVDRIYRLAYRLTGDPDLAQQEMRHHIASVLADEIVHMTAQSTADGTTAAAVDR